MITKTSSNPIRIRFNQKFNNKAEIQLHGITLAKIPSQSFPQLFKQQLQ